jgi:ABC-type multidrug transport system ATPase subunit
MSTILEARGLVKSFGRVRALDGLDLSMPSGQVRAIATLVRPDAGTLHVAGTDAVTHPGAVRRLVGLAGQTAAVEGALTGRENLELVAGLFGLDRPTRKRAAAAVIDQLGLDDAADRLARTYSGGMRRRLDLGASLVGRPRLLLLDEPTTGLDPRSRIELWDAIRELVAAGTDILLTTQYLDEADQLAQRIVIIDHGRVIADGTPDELRRRVGGDVIELRTRTEATTTAAASVLRELALDEPVTDAATRRVTIAADDIALRRATLDEVFLGLTGHASVTPIGARS